MKKQKRLTAAILTISMLLSNVAYAEELIDTKAVLDKIHSTISYSSDKIKNIASNIFNINSESGFSFENVEKDLPNSDERANIQFNTTTNAMYHFHSSSEKFCAIRLYIGNINRNAK